MVWIRVSIPEQHHALVEAVAALQRKTIAVFCADAAARQALLALDAILTECA
jgi:hypothetical protein